MKKIAKLSTAVLLLFTLAACSNDVAEKAAAKKEAAQLAEQKKAETLKIVQQQEKHASKVLAKAQKKLDCATYKKAKKVVNQLQQTDEKDKLVNKLTGIKKTIVKNERIAAKKAEAAKQAEVAKQAEAAKQAEIAKQAEAEPQTLTAFVNKYGMSPAAYKVQYQGMSEEQALRSTPDAMKTSGEMQIGYIKYGIE